MMQFNKTKYFIKHFIFIHVYMILYILFGIVMRFIEYAENNTVQRVNLHIDYLTSIFPAPYLLISVVLIVKKKYYKSVIYFFMFFYFVSFFIIMNSDGHIFQDYLDWFKEVLLLK